MARRKRRKPTTVTTGWIIQLEIRVKGRILRPGTEFKAVEHGTRQDGKRRLVRCRFTRYVETPTASWVEGIDTDQHFRAFRLDRIDTVHRTTKMRGATA